jgi:hypothetical protein
MEARENPKLCMPLALQKYIRTVKGTLNEDGPITLDQQIELIPKTLDQSWPYGGEEI